MHPTPLTPLTLLSIAIAIPASARPNPNPTPQSSSQSCTAPKVTACCDSFATNGTGVGCILSTLNILDPVCGGDTSLACCNAPQNGLVNVQCIPITVSL